MRNKTKNLTTTMTEEENKSKRIEVDLIAEVGRGVSKNELLPKI